MKKILIGIILFIALIAIYGFWINPSGFKVIENRIAIENLPSSFDGFKIVQFSDTLIKNSNDINNFKKVITSINNLNPDIIVFTGDLISSDNELNNNDLEKVENFLQDLECTLYKYAVIGDNDTDDVISILKNGNFTILDNASTYIFYKDVTPIKLSGLTNESQIDDALYMDDNLETAYNIVLTHYPDYIDTISTRNVDLVLAGHSLLGQVRIPFFGGIIKQNQGRIYTDSYYQVNETLMYVSSGLGCKKINFRLFNKPEINLYRLEAK